MNNNTSFSGFNCPFNGEQEVSITAAPKLPVWQHIKYSLHKVWQYITYAIINSYYLRHKNKIYQFIEKKIAGHNNGLARQPLVSLPTLAGDYCFVSDITTIKALLKHPRLANGELLSEGRQLLVIADALGRFRVSKEKQDMKQKRGILAHLLAKVERFLPKMLEISDELSNAWLKKPAGSFSITQDLRNFTVAIYLQSVMHYQGPTSPIADILEQQIDLLGKKLVYKTPRNFNKRFNELRGSLVNLLINDAGVQATTEYTKKLSEYIDKHLKQIQEHAFSSGLNSATLAGYLAPAPAFIAAVYEVGKHSHYQQSLFAEWQSKVQQEYSIYQYIEAEDTLLHSIVHEVLRLHPSQPFLFRELSENCFINHHHYLAKGTQLVIDLYHALRDATIWGNSPELFRPERFTENSSRYRSPFLVYSAGPNNCTGQHFSRLSLKVFLFSLIRNFTWKVDNQSLTHQFHFALNFMEDVKITLLSR